jgi:hypothetical protein
MLQSRVEQRTENVHSRSYKNEILEPDITLERYCELQQFLKFDYVNRNDILNREIELVLQYYRNSRTNFFLLKDEDAFHIAILLGRYAGNNYGRYAAEDHFLLTLEEKRHICFVRPLIYFQTSFLFLRYFFKFRPACPDISHFKNFADLANQPHLAYQIEQDFLECYTKINVISWVHKISLLDDSYIIPLCKIFRSTSNNLRQTQLFQDPSLVRFAFKLTHITALSLISVYNKATFDLDAIRQQLIKVYGDLLEWKRINEVLEIDNTDVDKLLGQIQWLCNDLSSPNMRFKDLQTLTDCRKFSLEMKTSIIAAKDRQNINRFKELVEEFPEIDQNITRLFMGTAKFIEEKMLSAMRHRTTFINAYVLHNAVYNYLRGHISLSNLEIKKENADEYLDLVKVFDIVCKVQNNVNGTIIKTKIGISFQFRHIGKLHFPHDTDEIRTKALVLNPKRLTQDGYTNMFTQNRLSDPKIIGDDRKWIPRANEPVVRAFTNQLIATRYLAVKLNLTQMFKDKIIATRGVTGSGKSSFITDMLNQIVKEIPDLSDEIHELLKGVLNPDKIKEFLKKHRERILNTQLHEEVSARFKNLFKVILEMGIIFVLDKRLLTVEDVVKNVLIPVQKLNKKAVIADHDVNVKDSYYRTLARSNTGSEACPKEEVLREAVPIIRRERIKLFYLVQNDPNIEYLLYTTSKRVLTVVNKIVVDRYRNEFLKAMRVPSDSEIIRDLNTIINDIEIDDIIVNGVILPDQRAAIEKWRGYTLQNAVKDHVDGKNPHLY